MIQANELDGTPFNDWLYIVKGCLKEMYNYIGDISVEAYKELYELDYSCEDAIKQLHVNKRN